MDISIIIPLCDRRNAGWKALESAVNQDFPRDRYQVVAVTGTETGAAPEDEYVAGLLARCDVVVRVDAHIDDVASEARFYQAGCERAIGDLLFFAEGHTVLDVRCCSTIAEHFRRHPDSMLAWAPRRNHDESPLGALITRHNLQHERRAGVRGTFSYGANSVIKRRLFARIGGLDARFLRQSETAVFDRAVQEHIAIGRIDEPLATHYNDMPIRQWRDVVTSAGAGKWAYYNARLACGEDIHSMVRHSVYLRANYPLRARVLYPLFRAAGAGFLLLALCTWRIQKALSYRLYVFALGCTDLSGFCRARLQATAPEKARPAPSAPGAAAR